MVEVGGGLRTYTVGGRSVLDGYGDDEMCSGGRGQVLMPWPNRLGDGRFEWDGAGPADRPHRAGAPQRHPRPGALGAWTVTDETANRVRLEYRLYPQPGWPWILDLAVTYALSDAGLEVRDHGAQPARRGRAVPVRGRLASLPLRLRGPGGRRCAHLPGRDRLRGRRRGLPVAHRVPVARAAS